MNKSGLKPCPFCGQDTAEFRIMNGRHGEFGFIQCQSCKAQGGTVKVRNEDILVKVKCNAAYMWNARGGDFGGEAQ